MEQGRGLSIHREKGVAKNGNTWIPLTPDKLVLACSNNDPSEIQQNRMGGENWQNLLGMYEGVLRNEQPHNLDLNINEGLNYGEHNHKGIPPAENCSRLQQNFSSSGIVGMKSKVKHSQDVAPVEAYNELPLNSDPNSFAGANNLDHSIQNVSILHKLRLLSQNAGRIGSHEQNLGEFVSPDSFAELMSIMNARRSCPSNESLKRSTLFSVKPTVSCPVSRIESNQAVYTSVGERVQENHILHGSNQVAYARVGAEFQRSHVFYEYHDGGGYNQQDIPKSKPSTARYTQNLLTPRPEARESSSASRSSLLGPVTPDQQNQSKTNQILQVPHLLIEDTSTSKKYMNGSVLLPSESEIIEKEHGATVANSIGTSTSGISTLPQDMKISDGVNGGIDLNKTPQQKTPKRAKHRPKVVIEGKPKRSPKPASTKRNNPDGTLPAKRKYVRKDGTKNSTPPMTDTLNVVEASDMGPAIKSCRRKLNFDMETGAENKGEKEGLGTQPRQPDHQEQNNECHKLSLDSSGSSASAAGAGHGNTHDKERRQTPTAYNCVDSVNNIPKESLPLETTALQPASRDHSLNSIARNFHMRSASIHQTSILSRYNPVHHCSPGGHPRLVFQANPCEQNLEFREHSSAQTTAQVLEDLMDATYKQGSKRAYKHTVIGSPQSITLMGSQLQSFGATERKTGSENFKKNIEGKFHGTSFNMNFGITTVEETIQQTESRKNKILLAQSSTKPQNGESRNSTCRSINHYLNDNFTNVICDPYMKYRNIRHKFQQHYASTQVHQCSEMMLPKTFCNSGDTQITKSVTAVLNRNMDSASIRDPLPIAGLTTYKKASVVDKFLQKQPKNKRSYGNSSKKFTGIRVVERNRVSVDDITDGMKDLRITNSSKELDWREQRALVSYRTDGAVVPYEEFDIVKKRIPRPKVDLDPETNRLWNLLMGNEGGDSADKMDTNKEKWWEEERKVFRGRVDSFIARMHLVQGDRRFSKWKGSVVDSVIGVFLTQNVSDHLSSSAFMSLAAKFPPKSTTAGEPCCQDVRITYPDGTTFHQKMVMEPVKGHRSVTLAEKANHSTDNVVPQENSSLMNDNVVPQENSSLMNDHTRITVEDIISSQSSSESFVLHASEDVRSSSGSNSEAECGWNISKNVGQLSVSRQAKRVDTSEQNKSQIKENSCPDKNLIDHQTFETPAYVQSPGWTDVATVQHHQNSFLTFTNSCSNTLLSMQNWKEDGLAFLGRESISTLTSKHSKGMGAQCMDDYRGQSAESAFVVSEDGRSKFQTSSINHTVLRGGLELQNDSLDESCSSNGQHFIKNMSEKHGPFHRGGTPPRDTKKPSDALSKQLTEPCDIRKPTEVETDIGHGQSSDNVSSKISITTSIARKRKAEKEKAEPFDWDTLRKQVHLKSGITERSREAMDSLDYEALHNADVHVISDTIKERGMNNKLAERMKNFLNRLVEDHEKIDLEWLRDVEPDKAKDYLLSIQGLGLKSVECVRLLTLHHLAFPVDTNVGRIAVRLGWVPLQPLPESLQLHLLELYPILESIQKYLWPRLCKLDQETLYELHYQMITFGKVFCTKKDPNCNACPMRGECRHFASAFASARLALPGPQERHIVRSSAAPMCSDNSSHVVIKPVPLLPSEDTIEPGVRLSKDCEPVIEEPKTPEPPIEVEERDIEDAFYEDPDEIPVIKLNIEEFATNVQSFIEEHIEIGGDMSKALVALNPGLPSIPTPKLKHISRLRTEHQVYELPDSHPLLKGMDRREPDDPSPYLLAIWTPGETADSVQAPESRCSYMERGGLCNNETCFSCNSAREAQAQTVRGTILIPCRTAMRGSFPLNGTYFQVNEVFADHESSLYPIDVPRSFLWNLPRRTVYFGSSVTSIFKGLTTEEIQFCFWKGFVCVRGFDQKTRAPRPLKARLHLPQSKMAKRNNEM